MQGSGRPPGTPSTLVAPRRMRFAFVGDSYCGKTAMLLRFYRDAFTHTVAPTQYELFNKTINVDGKDVELELWDTSGRIELHQLSLLSYLAWDAIFLCFSVNSDKKFTNAQTKWINEIRTHCHGAPIFLIGLKKDTRVGSGLWAPLFPSWETRIGASEGSMAANGIGAVKYMECSAKTGDGVYRIFEEGVRTIQAIRSGEEAVAREKTLGLGLGKLLCF
ncbi:ras family-domain-containing protein [Xylariales sp. AK1849]|nr:ras family-domain-containing protein [Xylariales sp. AK1849]